VDAVTSARRVMQIGCDGSWIVTVIVALPAL
jgi:hypothetical protein